MESGLTTSYEVWVYAEAHKVLLVLVALESPGAESTVDAPQLQLTISGAEGGGGRGTCTCIYTHS